ncbi:hypothetical protein [Kocuria sp. SM24M-10]|uniref:hypothetical protein n=1 Tax=Kocuria sp. SM24M-10 TaxID=1660349 RepID=UPI00064AA183|nr:hypothetical protein [Kocuria sp. SM24M-10]KLU11528.1 hypothetical protein ABL57_00750 [Kocuria sp. SM24M-10]
MYVVSLDQRHREAGDLAPALLRRLGDLGTVVPFQGARAHAVQGITADPAEAVAAALAGLRGEAWRVGIGVGPVGLETVTGSDGRTGLRADGPGTVQAHHAAAAAARTGRVPVCVAAEDAAAAARAQSVLRLLGRIVAQRTAAEWRVVDLLVPGARGQQKVVAGELGITPQAVSKAVARALWQEEWDARPAAARLLELCAPPGAGPGAQASTMNPLESIHS